VIERQDDAAVLEALARAEMVAVTLPTAPPLLWMDGGVRERHSARLDD